MMGMGMTSCAAEGVRRRPGGYQARGAGALPASYSAAERARSGPDSEGPPRAARWPIQAPAGPGRCRLWQGAAGAALGRTGFDHGAHLRPAARPYP